MQIVPAEWNVEGVYSYNGRFRCVGGHEYLTEDFQLNFRRVEWKPGGVDYAKWRRLILGYAFAHDGVLIDNSGTMLNLAARRHMCERKPEFRCGYDRYLRVMQGRTIEEIGPAVINYVREVLDGSVFDISMCDGAEILSVMPHIKLKIRKAFYDQALTDGSLALDVWLKWVVWKLKTIEWAKSGKYGRIIVDLGVGASMQGALFSEWCKKKFGDRRHVINDCCFWFVTTPDPIVVMEAFELLMSQHYRMCFVVFSDDCCASTRDGYANFDIASCDTSHTNALFEAFFDAFNTPTDIREALTLQILSIIKITNPDDVTENVWLQPLEMYLQSGITITTIANVFAWFCIFWRVAHSPQHTTHTDICHAAQSCGYIVTMDVCEQPEDLQFLKMSPALDDSGVYRAVLNLGVIMRASGVCKGDLPGRGDWAERALKFQTGLMNGLLAHIYCEDLEHLNPHAERPFAIDLTQMGGVLGILNLNTTRHAFSLEALVKRYRLTQDEIDEFRYVLKHSGLRYVAYPLASNKILSLDYGLALP